MAQCGSNTRFALIINSYGSVVIQRYLHLACGLLHGDLTRYRAIDLVGQPILTSDALDLEHLLDVLYNIGGRVLDLVEVACLLRIAHNGAGSLAKHILQLPINRLFARAIIDEGKLHIARCFANGVHRRALAVSNTLQVVDIFSVDHQTHTLLRLITDDFAV